MKRFKDFINSESGNFMVFEWSVLKIAFLLLIVVLLPDIILTGRAIFYTQEASSYAIQRAVEQGRMTETISDETVEYLKARNITDFEIYGTGEIKGFKEQVEVKIIANVYPMILRVLPSIRLSNSLALEDGVIQVTAYKMDASNVYIR
ncbi:hypothetical protein ACFYU8_18370 [Brevibacillus sp. NPDC003359]|uniref:hypothetical protein n=1 Tax=unclassified Brevibacillus TaxID=2684853 RepID=UPI00368BFB7E